MEKFPQIAVRIITIHQNRVLLVSNDRDGFFYFIGGKLQFGETIAECAQREIVEETSLDVKLTLVKILYLQELVKPSKDKHKVEVFILAEIDKFMELEGLNDPEHGGDDHLTWADIDNLPEKLFPSEIALVLRDDFGNRFQSSNIPHFVSIDS